MSKTYVPPRLTLPVGERDHAQGPPNAGTILVEYGDYQCPYCGAAYPVVKQVQKELGSSLRFVFRNFPITNAHPFAAWAAQTAEASAAQGRFWEMHDFLYENQQRLGEETPFVREQARLGLDVGRIAREVAEGTYASRIDEDFMSGLRSGVNGTPTFFVDGVRYDGAPEAGPLLTALRRAAKLPRGRVA